MIFIHLRQQMQLHDQVQDKMEGEDADRTSASLLATPSRHMHAHIHTLYTNANTRTQTHSDLNLGHQL